GDRLFELAAVERFALAAALDHQDLAQLHALEGRETRAAAVALAPAADRGVVLGRPRILYLAVLMRAERAAQLGPDPLVEHEAGTGEHGQRPYAVEQDHARDGTDRAADNDRLARG